MTEAEALGRLRRMTATATEDWPNELLADYLNDSLVKDDAGREPGDVDYVPTWDLHHAAALVWADKAAALAATAFDLQTDMTKANRSGQIDNAWRMARWHSTRAIPSIVSYPAWPVDKESGDNISADA